MMNLKPAAPHPILTKRFSDAVEFALAVHAAQVRKGTTIPYVSHLLAVASLVIEHGGSEDAAIAAMLHDAPEDCGGRPMLDQVGARFGKKVRKIVDCCTDTFDHPKPPWIKRKTRYIARVAKEDEESCLVSAADKLHNARAILHDLRDARQPHKFWSRFSASVTQIGWYYGSLESSFAKRLDTRPARGIVEELRQALDAIAALDGVFGAGLEAGRARKACPS